MQRQFLVHLIIIMKQKFFNPILAYLASHSVVLHFWRDSLLFDKTIVNSLRYNARVRPGSALSSRLERLSS